MLEDGYEGGKSINICHRDRSGEFTAEEGGREGGKLKRMYSGSLQLLSSAINHQ